MCVFMYDVVVVSDQSWCWQLVAIAPVSVSVSVPEEGRHFE